MSSKVNNLGNPSIDSLKIRIPLSLITSYDVALDDRYITINQTTGEESDSFKKQAKKYQCDEYSFYVSIARLKTVGSRIEECIVLLINSKQLEHLYFDGITMSNIDIIYNKVIDLGIFTCSYQTFLSAEPTDMDIKSDHFMLMDDYDEILDGVSKMTKDSDKVNVGKNRFKKEGNKGIEWGVRKTNNYLKCPFTKIYHKGLEFTTPKENKGSKEFKDRYLSHIDTSNIIRVETTIKNKKHLESLKLGLTSFTFRDMLELTEEQKRLIISNGINKQLLRRTRVMIYKDKDQLKPQQQFELNALVVCTSQCDFSLIQSIEYLSSGITNKDTKSRLKKRLNILYNDHIKDTDYAPKVKAINSFFDSIGWW